jgi:hypothetical protein
MFNAHVVSSAKNQAAVKDRVILLLSTALKCHRDLLDKVVSMWIMDRINWGSSVKIFT